MRSPRGDVDGRSDASSSRSAEETTSLKGKQITNHASKNTSSNPIEYTEEERAELLRRLDSIKDHLLRGSNNKPKATDQTLRPIHLHASPNPYPHYYPQGYHHQGYPPGHYPHSCFPATPSRYGDMMMMPPYSPVSSSHQRLKSPSFPSSMSSPGPRGGGYARWPSDLDSEMGGFPRGYVKKAVSDSDDARRCHPLAGGAPFIACHSCFELLYLPKKKLMAHVERQQHKLQCGACSEVISFTIVGKKLVFTSGNEGTTEPVSLVVEDRTTTNQELKNQVTQQQKEVNSVPRRAPEPAAAPESASLLELFEYSNVNRAALAYGMAELGYIKPDKQEFSKKQEDSVKAESVATETEVSYNGYSNTEISEDSTRCSNGREDQGKSREVWVNGRLIPEDLVSSAEKLAGPIQAGKYWYDYRAGFWGVMGKPCLGIIPPFIEEFSHPMPDRCAAGNTEVYVNGRELHKRDLELLVGRGLPRDKNRSYILDISGRILDGDSGEELKSLGKLAPTIEKTKHGFGMRVPRSLAS